MQTHENSRSVETSRLVEEHENWTRHRNLLITVPHRAAMSRRCTGLGLAANSSGSDDWVTHIDETFIPDHDLLWFMVQDMPSNHWLSAMHRGVQLATVHRTAIQYGMPSLGSNPVALFDIRRRPSAVAEPVSRALPTPHNDVLDPAKHPQWLRIFNAINWSMTGRATKSDRDWIAARREYVTTHGVDSLEDLMPASAGLAARGPANPSLWFPLAYLGFPAALRDILWQRTTQMGLATMQVTNAFKDAFIRALSQNLPVKAPCDGEIVQVNLRATHEGVPCTILTFRPAHTTKTQPILARTGFRLNAHVGATVVAGQVLGHCGPTLPKTWGQSSNNQRWYKLVPALFGVRLDFQMRLWFNQQMLLLRPGYVHLPVALAAPAALGSADDSALFWEVSAGLDYFDATADAFIFPPVPAARWNAFRSALTDDIDLDLFPRDPRFV